MFVKMFLSLNTLPVFEGGRGGNSERVKGNERGCERDKKEAKFASIVCHFSIYHKNEQRTVRAKRINMMNESERRTEERCETEKRDSEDERTAVHCKTYIH